MKRTLTFAAVVAVAIAGAAFAQGGMSGPGRGDGPQLGMRQGDRPAAMRGAAQHGDRYRAEMRGDGPLAMFDAFDVDGDGKITAAEVAEQRKARFAEADADGDGKIKSEEFAEHRAAQQKIRARVDAQRAFQWRDADGDGALTLGELIDPEPRMFDRFDSDGDGALTREEVESAWSWAQDDDWRPRRLMR